MTESRLPHTMERLSFIDDIRGRGCPWAIELVRDLATQEPSSDTAEDVLYFALRRGLSFKISMGNVLTLAPPLVTTPEQMSDAFDLADQGVSEVQ